MRLKSLLVELLELLERHKITSWAVKIKQICDNAATDDDLVTEDLKKLFRGAGTLDDLVISHSNGHLIDQKEEKEVNRRLEYLIQEIKTFF
ncbi:MAG: hypothetical protein PHN49_05080 [Candidatus Omnitrophica bacterium]|nr:hypothetical protein [Candidatus Omnitrophota bacterium]MDD5670993.1 hypothetical protein [Candidatus Omnitrophota bacterium]